MPEPNASEPESPTDSMVMEVLHQTSSAPAGLERPNAGGSPSIVADTVLNNAEDMGFSTDSSEEESPGTAIG